MYYEPPSAVRWWSSLRVIDIVAAKRSEANKVCGMAERLNEHILKVNTVSPMLKASFCMFRLIYFSHP